jgi:hypothetical protein
MENYKKLLMLQVKELKTEAGRQEAMDFIELFEDEVDQGESMDNEYEHAASSIDELIEENK